MNRSKKLCLLLGILAAACIATFAVVRMEERSEQIKNSGEIILEVPPDSVESLSWEYEGETLGFHRDGTWRYDEDGAFPVDEEKIKVRLELFQALSAAFIIEDVEDYGQYGLDAPVCTVRLETENQSYEILLGDYSKMDSQRYVSIGDGSVYLIQTDPLDYFDTALSEMIDHDDIPAFEDVTAIRFTGAEDYGIDYVEDSPDTYCAGDVYFTERDGKTLPLDTGLVDGYLDNISYLGLNDYLSYNATEEELADCGLDNPELTVTVDYAAEDENGELRQDTFVLHVSRDPEERKAAGEAAAGESEDGEEEEVTAYARVGESQIIYRLSSGDYKALMAASYDDLRHREVLSADFGDVTQVEIALEGSTYTLTAESGGEELVWRYQAQEVEVDDFQSALEGLTAEEFTEERPTQKEEIGLTVHLDNEHFPQVHITLYRYDGAHCLAEVDGEPVSLVGRSGVVDLIEAVNAIVLN